MIFGRNRSKRRGISSLALLLSICAFMFPASALAQAGFRQYDRQFVIGGRLPAAIILVGLAQDSVNVGKLLDIVAGKAGESFSRLDPQNPAGDVAKVEAKAGQGGVQVSDDVFAAFETAAQVSDWTKGAFDIAYAGEGNWHDIKISKGSSTVELKRSGMKIRFDPMIDGFMAELIARYLYTANIQNAIVKVGNVFRGIGSSLAGPWKIQVQDDAGTFARHALNLTIENIGAATVSASQFRSGVPDPRSKRDIQTPCRGVMMLANDAAIAEALASAIFIMNPDEGMKVLTKYGKGLIVDNNGKFMRSPGF
ncbi:MAG: FAD:protein FMN transferase [Pseudomonadota bacterium]